MAQQQQEWFIVRDGGKEEGPFSGQQLKQMAASGRLKRTDLVRRGDAQSAKRASDIKGLLPEGAATPAGATPAAPSDASGGAMSRFPKKTVIIASSVLGASLLLCCGVVGIFYTKARHGAQQELAQADDLWSKGSKAEAASKYRAILQNVSQRAALKDDEKARVYGRVIDFDLEAGNAESAKALFAEASKSKVTPAVNHPDAKAMVAREEVIARGEVLTADFYPHKKGAIFQTFQTGKLGGAEIDTRREYAHLDDGTIEKRTLQMTIVRPTRKEMPAGPPVKLLRREKNGFLEIGKSEPQVLKDVTFWNPLLKLGAVAGDEWEGGSTQFPDREAPADPKNRFKLVKFSQELIPQNIVPGDKVLCATIEETVKVNDGLTTIMEHVLGKGLGPVRTTGWEVKNRVRTGTFTESLLPAPKK
jgi:hypothetical protein